MSDETNGAAAPKSKRGGRRPGAGRKKKGHVASTVIGELDLKALLATPAPDEIDQLAQAHAHSSIDNLVRVMIHGRSDPARVNAANKVLDRGYGKPSIEIGGEPLLPFGAAPPKPVAADVRTEARKYANLAVEVLRKVAADSESEQARVTASASLLDRGLGTVAPAKLPEDAIGRPMGKKEQAQQEARNLVTTGGHYATRPLPRLQ